MPGRHLNEERRTRNDEHGTRNWGHRTRSREIGHFIFAGSLTMTRTDFAPCTATNHGFGIAFEKSISRSSGSISTGFSSCLEEPTAQRLRRAFTVFREATMIATNSSISSRRGSRRGFATVRFDEQLQPISRFIEFLECDLHLADPFRHPTGSGRPRGTEHRRTYRSEGTDGQ